jgi:hypothetical protein
MAIETENPNPIPTPSPTPIPAPKTEKKKEKELEKEPEVNPFYPKYAGYSCPVCGSKRLTNDSGKYVCPLVPKPSNCSVE